MRDVLRMFKEVATPMFHSCFKTQVQERRHHLYVEDRLFLVGGIDSVCGATAQEKSPADIFFLLCFKFNVGRIHGEEATSRDYFLVLH